MNKELKLYCRVFEQDYMWIDNELDTKGRLGIEISNENNSTIVVLDKKQIAQLIGHLQAVLQD